MGYGHGGGGPPVGVQVNVTSCPTPFLDATLFPPRGGNIASRFCAAPNPALLCCLPCPLSDWVFSDSFQHQAPTANYVGILTFVLNALLLLTYVVLPEEKSHRHYLSIGLTISLMILSLAFIIPLGTKPDQCFDTITPDDMKTDQSCAWTGALFAVGFMGAVVWILLRSIWTALRIVFDFKRTTLFKYISLSLGIGLPLLFMALTIGINGVTYRLYNVCMPNGARAFLTWFVWLLLFSSLSTVILILTILYCLWKFALSAFAGGAMGGFNPKPKNGTSTSTSSTGTGEPAPGKKPTPRAMRRKKRVEWARIQRVLYLQWRTILLAFVVLNETVFFGLVFVQQTAAIEQSSHGITPSDLAWGLCLIQTGGDKNACIGLSSGLGLSEPRVIATLQLAATLGIIVFLLMLRRSMFTGWYEILSHPRESFTKLLHPRRPSVGSQDFILQDDMKHMSLPMPLESERKDLRIGTGKEREVEPPLLSPNTQTRQALGFDRGGSIDEERGDEMDDVQLHDEVRTRDEVESLQQEKKMMTEDERMV
ncbi:hypothetical protein LTR53_011470 [Teratosphaeriaceae sp. CCFEE 6253]|nr:hypothetical protein LTR53_011470 [Teratosphaeriaceae sp. CCFEE 6253]